MIPLNKVLAADCFEDLVDPTATATTELRKDGQGLLLKGACHCTGARMHGVSQGIMWTCERVETANHRQECAAAQGQGCRGLGRGWDV
eukprot:scaffold20476_cov17-Tisochrysis_lutea.AAC.1